MQKYKVTVLVEPTYLEDHSDPFEDSYLWAYKVRIRNNGNEKIKLISRHWKIFDSNGNLISESFAFDGADITQLTINSGQLELSINLDIDGDKPAHGSVIYNEKKEDIGIVTAALWSPTLKKNIALASLQRPYGIKIKENIFSSHRKMVGLIWASYQKLIAL